MRAFFSDQTLPYDIIKYNIIIIFVCGRRVYLVCYICRDQITNVLFCLCYFRQTILGLLGRHQVVVISGETGCGKTTQVGVTVEFHNLSSIGYNS